MKRMACGTAATIALVGLAACFSNPALDLNTDNFHIVQPTPLVMFTKVGDSIQLRLRLVNDANNGAVTSFVIAGIGSGISVRYDDKFRPYYLGGGDTLVVPVDKDIQQYYVKGLAPGKWTFSATATANTAAPAATITVTVEAIDLGAALSRTTGLNPGDTVNITAPTGLVFSQTSAVTFATGTVVVVGRATDSTQIRVIVGPGVSGVATVTKVGTAANGVIGTQTLKTTSALTAVPSITNAPTTVSTASPAFGATMTVALGGSLRFTSNSVINIGGSPAWILSRSADSSTATIVPLGVASGAVTYTSIVLSFLNGVALSVPGDKTVTVGAPVADPNTSALATAPTVVLAAVGSSIIVSGTGPFNNAGQCGGTTGDGCELYKFVLANPTSYDINFVWQGGSDMGLYRLNSSGGGASSQGGCDNGGQGSTGQPELCIINNRPAGTYFFAVVFFGTGSGYPAGPDAVIPAWYQFRVRTITNP